MNVYLLAYISVEKKLKIQNILLILNKELSII